MNASPSQSALDPAGAAAREIMNLFYGMTFGAVLIWIVVVGLSIYAILYPGRHDARTTRLLVIGGGAIFPILVLTALLAYGLSMMPELHRPAPAGSQVIHVAGVRWWWRVSYQLPSGESVETANELHLPVDQAVEFRLTSEDVIHSFWIPSVGGKMDMIPGRSNRVKLVPDKIGVYRGVCAEFCGAAHAKMSFDVIIQSQEEFDLWLANLGKPADETFAQGIQAFLKHGCSGCHAIRGTQADGVVGPDLTHFGGRRSIGATMLRNTPENLRHWIEDTHIAKPGVQMPAFTALEQDELDTLVTYLGSLR
jgi:cytochrome c oxidase subunit II